MSKVTVLGSGEISKLINIRMAIDAVEQAYIQKSSGSGGLWPMVFHEFEPGVADLDIKSGDLGDSGFFGLKLVSWYGENPSCSLPALFGTALLFDIRTGEPKALLNAGGITAYRTGAAAAIGAKHLARPDSETLLMAGTGEISPYLTAAGLYLMPQLKTVLIANPRKPEKAAEVCTKFTSEVDALLAACGLTRMA